MTSGKTSAPVMYLILGHTQFKKDIGQLKKKTGRGKK